MNRETILVIVGATLVLLVPGACGMALVGLVSSVNDVELRNLEEPEPAPPIVTLAEFERIETGMSYRDVVDVIGDSGIEIAPSSVPGGTGGGPETSSYVWRNSDASYMTATFESDRLLTRSQSYLE